ncbi:hypothetical protein VPNG_05176 [Cytospora leucostoma]|uniref:Uncharacterized protein n=1 Tax=Cytospora leucostoma TaxID=1230097 RepID=A0A423X7I9_9PEZI|nr:hypothetical protein VPNG_05176 [Cytospora leucostoma]
MSSYSLQGKPQSKQSKGSKGNDPNSGKNNEGISLNEFTGADDNASTRGQYGSRQQSVASSSGGQGQAGQSGNPTSGTRR